MTGFKQIQLWNELTRCCDNVTEEEFQQRMGMTIQEAMQRYGRKEEGPVIDGATMGKILGSEERGASRQDMLNSLRCETCKHRNAVLVSWGRPVCDHYSMLQWDGDGDFHFFYIPAGFGCILHSSQAGGSEKP